MVDARCARHLVGGLVPWSGTLPDLDAGATGPEVGAGADAGDAIACGYPSTSRVDDSGKTYWWYAFDWRQDNLADICASYGAGAKMVVELSRGSTPSPITGLPVCTGEEVMGAGGRSCAVGARLETDCMAGSLLFEADAESGGEYSAYYFHIESPQFPDPPRRLLEPDATCRRSLHPRFVPMGPAGSPDIGADTGGSFADLYDPSRNGQPCQTNSDCPFYSQECVIDATVTDCQAGPSDDASSSLHRTAWPIRLDATVCTSLAVCAAIFRDLPRATSIRRVRLFPSIPKTAPAATPACRARIEGQPASIWGSARSMNARRPTTARAKARIHLGASGAKVSSMARRMGEVKKLRGAHPKVAWKTRWHCE